jgi:hypothetical protein
MALKLFMKKESLSILLTNFNLICFVSMKPRLILKSMRNQSRERFFLRNTISFGIFVRSVLDIQEYRYTPSLNLYASSKIFQTYKFITFKDAS